MAASVHERACGQGGLGSSATQLMRAVGRFILNPPTITEGTMTAPNLTGHVVQFDWDGLEQHRIR